MQKYCHMQDIILRNNHISDRGIIFINGLRNETFVSYQQLYHRSLRTLRGLREAGVQAGQELLFQLDDNELFVDIFWACIMGQIIPVPVTFAYNDETRLKVFKVWSNLKEPYFVYTGNSLDGLAKFTANHPSYTPQFEEIKQRSLNAAKLMSDEEETSITEPDPEQIAFIQFSSGSTGDPKGVVLTHRNLIANASAIAEVWSLQPMESSISWMPLTHDMGLICLHITSSLKQANQYIMPANLFMRNPMLWMEKTHEHRIQYMVSPNFGYKHFMNFLNKDEQDYQWDLSQVKYIINGAEPISREIADSFMEQMGRYGLKPSAMKPGYGLAEGSVAVCLTALEAYPSYISVDSTSILIGQPLKVAEPDHKNSMFYAEVGGPVNSCEIRISDGDGNSLDDFVLGHIQIKGSSVTQGYYNNPEASRRVLDQNGWLDTGDLGFMHDGHLVVIGREKDVLFVNGQNVFSSDIERVAMEVEGIELWSVAVCGGVNLSKSSEDVLLFLQYRKKDFKEFLAFADRVAKHIHHKMGIIIDFVLPVKSIPRTTSGKIQRYKLSKEYTNGDFNSIIKDLEAARVEEELNVPVNTTERLSRLCHDILGVQPGIHESFNEIGASSVALLKITDELTKKYGIEVAVTDLYKYPTISKLSCFIDRGGGIRVPSIQLPEQYFGTDDHFGEAFQAALDHETCLLLQEVAKVNNVDVGDLLIAVFVYVLKEISEENFVSIQCAVNELRIASISIDFSQLDTLEAISKFIRLQMDGWENAQNYTIQDLEYVQRDSNERGIIPYFTKYPSPGMNDKLNGVFDILLQISEEEDQIEMRCDYNNDRLNKEKVREMFTQYVIFMTDVIDHFKKAYA